MNEVLQSLIDAPESLNPAVVMHVRLREQRITVAEMLLLKPEIDKAIKAGAAEKDEVSKAARALMTSDPATSREVPEGF